MSALPDTALAEFFQVDPTILHLVPELLADVWALGSDPEQIVRQLQAAGLAPAARVLDLGCGKGAVSLAVAEAFAATVDGTDAFAPFVADAVQRAEAVGLGQACRFRCEDLSTTVAAARDYDAVLYISVGNVFGGPRDTVAALRRTVRPGGLIVLDDGYRASGDDDVAVPGYGHMLGRQAAIAGVTAFGDRLLGERLIPPEDLAAQNRAILDVIEARADTLATRSPQYASALAAHVAQQRAACEVLDNHVRRVTWVIERAS